MTDLRHQLESALQASYRIERELGGGGMSRVFLAEETALGRQVVVKVLPPEMAAGVNQDRFRREIHLAAKLQHPHIVPLLSAGSSGELLWYVMPFIEGESLRVRLERRGELPIREAIQILREVADALSYAHEHGVVHRDIKPDNVLISGRHVLVTDFGVAKAVSESTGGTALTSVGLALGTPAYMAPEQAAADPHVDHRADLYALGALGYELVTGRPPFTGLSPQGVLAAQITRTPDPIATLRPAVPAALAALIMRCLEKRPADRWQRADELIPELEAMLAPTGGTLATGARPTAALAIATRLASPAKVAGLFGLASVAVIAGVAAVVRTAGLPDWVTGGAIGLLTVGLPITVIATGRERLRARASTSGQPTLTPTGLLAPLGTLRGALRGGVLAFLGLAVAAGGFMGLRAAGVAPFATLLTAGSLKDRDGLVVADFDNRSTDATLAPSITEALRIDLTRSPVVHLLEGGDVAASLIRMNRDPATPLSGEVAREVAAREGAKAVVTGEIAPLGAGFVLSARVIGVESGQTLLADRETADGTGGLIAAVDRLSRKLREGIGESLRSIRAGQPLEAVTTGSLEALRKYTQAERAADLAKNDEAIGYLEEATRLDSTFAMAWRKLAVVIGNQQLDRAREIGAATQAYTLRDRLPERERLIATAYYHAAVTANRDATIQAYTQLLARWPDDLTALNNLAEAYQVVGRYAEAEQAARRGVAVGPATGVLWFNLIDALTYQGRFAAADSALQEWRKRYPEARNRLQVGFRLAFGKGDYRLAGEWADSVTRSDQQSLQALGLNMRAGIATLSGRPAEGERLNWEAMKINQRRGATDGFFHDAVEALGTDLWFRNQPEVAKRRMDSLLARHPIDSLLPANRPHLALAEFFARAGDPDRAERHYQSWEQSLPQVVRDGEPTRFVAAGMIALAKNRPTDAIAAFRAFQTLDGCAICWLYEIGLAFEQLQQPDSARVAYRTLVSRPEPGRGRRDYTLAPALQRLGEMAENSGDKPTAVEYYTRLLDLWRSAEPEIQPRVKEIKKRVAGLVGEAPNPG